MVTFHQLLSLLSKLSHKHSWAPLYTTTIQRICTTVEKPWDESKFLKWSSLDFSPAPSLCCWHKSILDPPSSLKAVTPLANGEPQAETTKGDWRCVVHYNLQSTLTGLSNCCLLGESRKLSGPRLLVGAQALVKWWEWLWWQKHHHQHFLFACR